MPQDVRSGEVTSDEVDVAVVGGGAAGLAAATVLGRSRRSVLVIDAGRPRNAPADGVHSFLSRDGMPPGALLAVGRDEVRRYGGQVRTGEAVSARPVDTAPAGRGFEVTLADGDVVRARRLIVTTGLVDELPDVPGLRERWGRDVVHCPYCHGWEVRDLAIGVLGTGPMAVHQAMLFRQLTDDLTLVLDGAPALSDEQREQLDARGVRVVEGEVRAVEIVDDAIAGLRLASGEFVAVRTVAVGAPAVARSAVLDSLGLQRVPHPMGAAAGSSYPSEAGGATTVPGVRLAGNVTDLSAQVISAAAAGVMAAAMTNMELIEEDTQLAVERARVRAAS